ncbi:uncharacterized protein LOC132794153 [Drosophila nasuta]|uniref:Uncharacterized protein LOC117572800 n=1 Tax=Drosophila albomicans TaxID=7291 RepID=A0A9C6T5S2_DROAB|nr:uncharacterized protein LOC117572800 [Drosophila albomicans]XP_060660404.1 uncharacterized protein LOC132794153 [Drosophila nasuta]
MFLRRCCFCVPLRTASEIIGTLYLGFFFTEMSVHGQQSIFICAKSQKWDVLQAALLTSGVISSLMLIYGSYKENRCFVLVWLIDFLIIFIAYVVLTILDVAIYHPLLVIIIIECCILVSMLYALIIVSSFYRLLRSLATEAVQI